MSKDQYQGHDYYFMDELLSDEHKLIRDSARAWVKKEVSPIIDDYYERAEFPNQILNGLAGVLEDLDPIYLKNMVEQG